MRALQEEWEGQAVARPLGDCRLPEFATEGEWRPRAAFALREGVTLKEGAGVEKPDFLGAVLPSFFLVVLGGLLLSLFLAVTASSSGWASFNTVLFPLLTVSAVLAAGVALSHYRRKLQAWEQRELFRKAMKSNLLWNLTFDELESFKKLKTEEKQEEARALLAEVDALRESKLKVSGVASSEERERLGASVARAAEAYRKFIPEALREEAMRGLPEAARRALAEPATVAVPQLEAGVFLNYPLASGR